MPQPLILFFSADRNTSDLDALEYELKGIQNALFSAIVFRKIAYTTVNVEDIEEYKSSISRSVRMLDVFHFAGHAGIDALKFKEDVKLKIEALAAHLEIPSLSDSSNGIKLAFLNGCSTANMIDALLKVGVHAVIGTTAKIEDVLAKDFAVYFYQAIANGESLHEAFKMARANAFTNRPKKLLDRVKRINRDDIGLEVDDDLIADWCLVVNKECEYILDWRIVPDPVLEVKHTREQMEAESQQIRFEASLKKINYNQREVFEALVDKRKVSSFIIHGEPCSGQEWLVYNILLPPLLSVSNTKTWFIDRRIKTVDIISEIKKKLDIECLVSSDFDLETEEIATSLVARLETTPTCIAIYNDNNFLGREEIAEQFIMRFWSVLARKVNELQPKNHLILLIIDLYNIFPHDKLCVQTGWEANPFGLPVRLEPIKNNKMKGDIDSWVRFEKREGGHPLQKVFFANTSEENYLDECIRRYNCYEDFLKHICELAGYDLSLQNDRSYKIMPLL